MSAAMRVVTPRLCSHAWPTATIYAYSCDRGISVTVTRGITSLTLTYSTLDSGLTCTYLNYLQSSANELLHTLDRQRGITGILCHTNSELHLLWTVSSTGWKHTFLLARRYATATCLSDRPSVRPSVCHTPVLRLAKRKQDREIYTIW